MGHEKLASYFNTNFALWKHHQWSLDIIEAMMPWERYVYMELLSSWIKEEEVRRKELEAQHKATMQSINRRQRR
jgi:hypothetical protein